MTLQSATASLDFSRIVAYKFNNCTSYCTHSNPIILSKKARLSFRAHSIKFDADVAKEAKGIVTKRICSDFDGVGIPTGSRDMSVNLGLKNLSSFTETQVVGKLGTEYGVLSSTLIDGNIVGLFAVFFLTGVVFDKLWTVFKSKVRPRASAGFSFLWDTDLQRKETVEWVNMVLGKLWKVYRKEIENWMIGLLQPVMDDLKKPDYVERVEIKEFSLGDEPFCIRNVERRTSRRVDDLQYQIGLRYAGDAYMLLMLSLKFGIIPVVVPVGVRDFDIDGELWVKMRLIPLKPWVGDASWAFVSLPKIKFELSAFRLFNLMTIPLLSMFLTKLFTKDLPLLFVRPQKINFDHQEGEAVGPVANCFELKEMEEERSDFVGELSLTLIDAHELSYIFYGKTDPYVILRLGDQVIRSKRNSQTTVVGPPGEPIWNQDFHMLVANPKMQKLHIQVRDTLGFAQFTIGSGEVDLVSLPDTIPTERVVVLQRGWGLLGKRPAGKIVLRLTFKAYVDDKEDVITQVEPIHMDVSDKKIASFEESSNASYRMQAGKSLEEINKGSFMDGLADFLVSKEFQGIVSSETRNTEIINHATPRETASSAYDAESQSSATNNFTDLRGSALFWLAVVTSVSLLIALSIGGSSAFNP